jgi:hypothetical protein
MYLDQTQSGHRSPARLAVLVCLLAYEPLPINAFFMVSLRPIMEGHTWLTFVYIG